MLKTKLAIFLVVYILGTTCFGQDQFKFEEKIESLVEPYLEARKFKGLSVGVIADGDTWTGNYGQVSDEKKTKPSSETIYEIGSISKVFTSLMLADAINSGEVMLDTRIGELMPEIKETKPVKTITLKHLATHMSGLPKLPTNVSPKEPENPYADYDRKKLVEYMKVAQLDAEPGENHEYSNVGAGLLGDLLAAQANQTYESLLKNRILNPLKMKDTTIALTDEQSMRLAPPFNSAMLPARTWDFDSLVGAGAIRSTTDDMIRFMQANLAPPKNAVGDAIELAWKQHLDAGKNHRGMGLGWQIAGDGSTRWHNGQTGGYQSMMLINRKINSGVVVLCNTSGSEIDGLAGSIIQLLAGMDPNPRKFAKTTVVDKATVKRLAGKYQLAPQVIIEVVAKEDRLVVKLTGQTFLKVVPESDTVWNYTDVEAQLKFDLPNKGPAKKVTLLQNGQKMPAPRIK